MTKEFNYTFEFKLKIFQEDDNMPFMFDNLND
jgi:hypothetical protein